MATGTLIGREFESEPAEHLEASLWGGPRDAKERAAGVHEVCAEIIDWKNPEPLPDHLVPDPPPGLRYWLEGK